ncbi:NADH-quinone oxidoreductase subunit A [Fulvivirga sedimenti]|uniref:NADH-quinone oxidoreductase subunit A n=1 Tax=Fulvivirga sedimenti TaxID=2879465 RepID=A0A9X1HNT6_9BACT|nr:NADH-quinone oxidoreductase subunit A [Fulvivirga sedimenti]MCA6074022.1 NADH-quinone oxidoreductase subunit A [Fulvivirga sedimenti]
MYSEVSGFGEVLLYIIVGVIFIGGGMFTARLLRPNRPDERKLETYESGESPVGMAWGRINIRFYLFALIFLLFEVEIVFLFPWAVVFGDAEMNAATDGAWGWFTLIEMFVFVLVLFLGLVYAWVKGYLDWPRPVTKPRSINSPVPREMYDAINKKYSGQQ